MMFGALMGVKLSREEPMAFEYERSGFADS